jgi:hypothetical protein
MASRFSWRDTFGFCLADDVVFEVISASEASWFCGSVGSISPHAKLRCLALGLAEGGIGAFGGHVARTAAVMMKPAAWLAAHGMRSFGDGGLTAIDAHEFDRHHGRDGDAMCVSSQRTERDVFGSGGLDQLVDTGFTNHRHFLGAAKGLDNIDPLLIRIESTRNIGWIGDHILRDIDALLTAPDLGASDWFRCRSRPSPYGTAMVHIVPS